MRACGIIVEYHPDNTQQLYNINMYMHVVHLYSQLNQKMDVFGVYNMFCKLKTVCFYLKVISCLLPVRKFGNSKIISMESTSVGYKYISMLSFLCMMLYLLIFLFTEHLHYLQY